MALRISLFVVGRLRESYLQEAEAEYVKRLGRLAKLEVREFASDAAMAAAIENNAVLVLFDERGQSLDSAAFARDILERHAIHGGGAPLIFAIGGADGHSDSIRRRANQLVAFGQLTIAHRLVRILVVEQIYRGLSIIAGLPYHRGKR